MWSERLLGREQQRRVGDFGADPPRFPNSTGIGDLTYLLILCNTAFLC